MKLPKPPDAIELLKSFNFEKQPDKLASKKYTIAGLYAIEAHGEIVYIGQNKDYDEALTQWKRWKNSHELYRNLFIRAIPDYPVFNKPKPIFWDYCPLTRSWYRKYFL